MNVNDSHEEVYYIPANYTDAGKIFGMLEIRNTLEAVVVTVPLVLAIITIVPTLLWKTIVVTAIALPAFVFLLIGIEGYSTVEFLQLKFKWKKIKKVLRKKVN